MKNLKTYHRITNLETCPNWKVRKFLEKAGINQTLVDKLNIGYTEWDDTDREWSNRIIFRVKVSLFKSRIVGVSYIPEPDCKYVVR